MNSSTRITLMLCTTLLLALLCQPMVARAQARGKDQPVLSIGLAEAASLGPRQRMPLRAHLAKADGTPIAGALVAFFVEGQPDGQARTDTAGNAAWRLQRQLGAGRYNVRGVFEGLPGLLPARATFVLDIEATTITLAATPAQVGGPLPITARISRASGAPLANAPVVLLVAGKRVAAGRSAPDGTLTLHARRDLPVGEYQAEAVFEGLPGILPSRATTALSIRPTWLEIETVPHLPGALFALDGQQFVADEAGIARVAVDRAGSYTLSALPWTADDTGIHATFARWMDDTFASQRRVRVPANGRIQAGFDISYQVRASFRDLEDRPVDSNIVSSVVITSSDRTKYILNGAQPRWLPGSRVVRLGHGLEARPIGYVAGSVIVDGSNVVNQGQQRFDPTLGREWPIRLLLYSTHFIVRDAMFGFPTGSSLRLTYPDGTVQVRPLDSQGELTTGLLARGGYSASVEAQGISAAIPIVLSRNQDVRLMVISYLDLAVLGLIMAVIGLGLIFVGRPRLLSKLRSPGWLAGKVLTTVRAARPQALPWRQPRRARSRLRLLDPTVIVALSLMVIGAGGAASATRFTTTYANSPVPQPTALPTARPQAQLAAAATTLATQQPTATPEPPASTPTSAPQVAQPEPSATPTSAPRTLLTFDVPLRSESKGPQVVQLQQRLRELGYFTYPENTGQFAAQTRAAVTQFQADRGLPVTGLVGPLTIEALNSCTAVCARSNNSPEKTR